MARFQKNWTRDTSLIIQEMCAKVCAGDCGVLDAKYSNQPILIDYLDDGIMEIWENADGIAYLRKNFVAVSQTNPKKISDAFKFFEATLPRLEAIWHKGWLDTVSDLNSFLDLLEKCMQVDIISVLLSDEPSAQASVFAWAKRLRTADRLFATSDAIIRASIAKIFPEYAKYAVCIRQSELGNLPSIVECEKRLRNFVSTSAGYTATESLEEFQQKNPQIIFEYPKVSNLLQLTGQIAMEGFARGKVKILEKIAEMGKVKIGDIIVSPMTTPALLPAMKRASAFVTDEGGMLCHAAVVAREMKKPCIIGTKVATEIFKDDDEVEVDANNGIVRKI